MKKIMVIDTHGGQGLTDRYRALLPHVNIRGIEPASVAGTPCHPHGLMAAYYAGALCHEANGARPEEFEIILVRIFDEKAQMVADAEMFMLSVIERDRPTVITRSWGGTYANDQFGKMSGEVIWGPFVQKYRALQQEIGFVDFGSAGNSGDWSKADDTGYPQRLMPEICNVIGSARRDGYPSEFSSDGPSVQCVAWADRIQLADANGWSLGSGTSFSCPKMAGLCAILGLDLAGWREFVAEKATRPEGFVKSWKWGTGNMEEEYQTLFRRLPAACLPPTTGLNNYAQPLRWFDYERL